MTLNELAEIYPQLYLTPGVGMSQTDEYKDVTLRGKVPEHKDLSGFVQTKEDKIFDINTPAGKVRVVYLANREDFERFINIIYNKCEPKEYPKSMGASTISGINNWTKINKHKMKFITQGGRDWDEEFKLFTKNPENYKDTIIVLSKGGYSAIKASDIGYTQSKWTDVSFNIRLYHECTHFICKKLYPDNKDALLDEILADCIGLVFALGYYDKKLAKLFLGVNENGYAGGRLENYLEDNQEDIDNVAKKVSEKIDKLSEWVENLIKDQTEGFDILIKIEDNIDMIKDY